MRQISFRVISLSSSTVFRVAIASSAIVIVGFFLLMSVEVCTPKLVLFESCVSKWNYLFSAPPNEIGDTLAGVAGALAFIWVAASVVIQRIELDRTVGAFVEQGALLRQKADRDAFDLFVRDLADRARHDSFGIVFDRQDNVIPRNSPLVPKMGSQYLAKVSSAVLAKKISEQVFDRIEEILGRDYKICEDGSRERLAEWAEELRKVRKKSESWQSEVKSDFESMGFSRLEKSVQKLKVKFVEGK